MSVSIGNGFEMHCGLHGRLSERSYGAQTLEERRHHGLRFASPVANFKRRYAAGSTSLLTRGARAPESGPSLADSLSPRKPALIRDL